jgi:hypothetical protein
MFGTVKEPLPKLPEDFDSYDLESYTEALMGWKRRNAAALVRIEKLRAELKKGTLV